MAVLLRQSLLVMTGVAAVVCAASLRIGVILSSRVDRDLVSTTETRPLEVAALIGMIALSVLAANVVLRGRTWLAETRAALQLAWDRGDVGSTVAAADGTMVRRPDRGSRRILVARAGAPAGTGWHSDRVASSTGTAGATLGLALTGSVLMIAGVIAVVVAADRDAARTGWTFLAAGAAPMVLAATLSAWLVGDIDRRRRVADLSVSPSAALTDDQGARRWPSIAIAVLAILAAFAPATGARDDASAGICPSETLECRWVTVEADHAAGDRRGPTRTVAYGLLRATGTKIGTLVIATGGPGISGVGTWDVDYATLDPRLTAAFDIVAFDPRGTGGSDGVDCPRASEWFWNAVEIDSPAAVITSFPDACLAEAGVTVDQLDEYAGDQIAEDIEAIRDDLDAERIVLYGESYGTATAQRYAMAHPDRLQALILDGVVDIAHDSDDAWLEAAVAFDHVLGRVFDWCATDLDCSDELSDPATAWKRLLASLDARVGTTWFADATGTATDWTVTGSGAVDAISDAMYWETGRMLAMRALAAADRGDLVPLGRMIHPGGTATADFVFVSDFAYVASLCADRVDEDAAWDAPGYLAWTQDEADRIGRMARVLLSGAACAAWPVPAGPRPPTTLPSSLAAPVIILTSTADPITPPAIGRRLAARFAASADVYRIETSAGPHVTFGRGDPCTDDTIVEFLIDGDVPPERTTCIGQLVAPFLGVARPSTDVKGLALRAYALDDELYNHPDYASWHGEGEVRIGCRFGGSILVSETTEGHRIAFTACAVLDGEPMTGTGHYRFDGTAMLEVRFPRGDFLYEIGADGVVDLSGTFDRETVRESW